MWEETGSQDRSPQESGLRETLPLPPWEDSARGQVCRPELALGRHRACSLDLSLPSGEGGIPGVGKLPACGRELWPCGRMVGKGNRVRQCYSGRPLGLACREVGRRAASEPGASLRSKEAKGTRQPCPPGVGTVPAGVQQTGASQNAEDLQAGSRHCWSDRQVSTRPYSTGTRRHSPPFSSSDSPRPS